MKNRLIMRNYIIVLIVGMLGLVSLDLVAKEGTREIIIHNMSGAPANFEIGICDDDGTPLIDNPKIKFSLGSGETGPVRQGKWSKNNIYTTDYEGALYIFVYNDHSKKYGKCSTGNWSLTGDEIKRNTCGWIYKVKKGSINHKFSKSFVLKQASTFATAENIFIWGELFIPIKEAVRVAKEHAQKNKTNPDRYMDEYIYGKLSGFPPPRAQEDYNQLSKW